MFLKPDFLYAFFPVHLSTLWRIAFILHLHAARRRIAVNVDVRGGWGKGMGGGKCAGHKCSGLEFIQMHYECMLLLSAAVSIELVWNIRPMPC